MLRQLVIATFSFVFALSSASAENIVVAPVLTDANASGEAMIGALIADYKQGNPNALDIIRAELKKMQDLTQAKAKKDGVFLSTTYRFTPETLTFFAAIGLVTTGSMWIRSHGDPLAMEKHIQSLKDPIAHMSFYAFMLTNGFYMDFRTSSAGFKTSHPDTQRRMMRRFNYQGMALGSLASSITADLGHSGKMCVDSWILGKEDEKSVQSCNDAWKSWTARNKFTQYFPLIISMWASQAAADIIDSGARKVFGEATTTELAKKLLNKEWLIKQAYKVTGADVALTFAGGTWAMKSIRWAGHVTKFTMFVGIDHFLSPFIFRPMNNLIRPAFFDFDAYEINKFWKAYDNADWDEKKVRVPHKNCFNPLMAVPIVGFAYQFAVKPKCEPTSLDKEIDNYTVQVQQWREHLNADVEADLAGWLELTKELLNQMEYSYKFYRTFVDSIFETLNIGYRIQQNADDKDLMTNKSNFPFRTLPLYGVSMGNAKAMGGADDDLYLTKPTEIEKRQLEYIKEKIRSVDLAVSELEKPLHAEALGKFKSIVGKIVSDDVNQIAAGLNEMNQILSVVSVTKAENSYSKYAGTPLFEELIRLRNLLGNPLPVVYPLAGFTQAFAVNAPMKIIAAEADYSLWSVAKRFKFSKESDLMLYKLICGNEKASFDKTKVVLTNIDALAPQFDPPSLLKPNSDRKEFCEELRTTNNLYSTPIAGKSLRNYLLENLKYEVIGDYQNKASKTNLDAWWGSVSKTAVSHEFEAFDQKFKALTVKTQNNMFNHRSLDKRSADKLNQSKYLQTSLVAQLKTEAELYLQLIQRALTPTADATLRKIPADHNYLEATVESAKKARFFGLYSRTYLEVQKISELLNTFYPIMLQENVDFNGYIQHSKKIDTAINDILVSAGLKTIEVKETDILADPAATGNENSESTYKDVDLKELTLRQRVIISSVKGLRQVESEVRRFIRMKVMLSKGLEIDYEQMQADFGSQLSGQQNSKQRSASPRGHVNSN